MQQLGRENPTTIDANYNPTMSELVSQAKFWQNRKYYWALLALLVCASIWQLWPEWTYETAQFTLANLKKIAPLVIPGILLSAWVNASGAGETIRKVFEGRLAASIFLASFIGAITPVCGLCVLPLMVGLLVSGVPTAPVIAFWLSSPITDPALFAATAGVLGLPFALGKTIAAFAIGMLGGLFCVMLRKSSWTESPLRPRYAAAMNGSVSSCNKIEFMAKIWKNDARWQQFKKEVWSMTKLVALCLGLAFIAERLLQQWLQPEALTAYLGSENWWSVPISVFVGAPAYLDGYAALPLTRGLIDHGMSWGAAMAFLVSGGIVSIWGAMAIFPVLRAKPFLLYLLLAVVGSLLVGWGYELAVS